MFEVTQDQPASEKLLSITSLNHKITNTGIPKVSAYGS
jgi:hypothetical protein